MDQMRAALVDDMRQTTAADAKGNRKMLLGALSLLAPDHPLRRRLAGCGKRNEATDTRYFCHRPVCGVCMGRQANRLFEKRLWPALGHVPSTDIRWITVLLFRRETLDDEGVREMARQHRRLLHVLSKFVGQMGKKVRVWGAREVERTDDGWQFHIHLLVDFAGADPNELAKMLRGLWGEGDRQVLVKVLERREHRSNIIRFAHYMTKARFTRSAGNDRVWMSNEDMVTYALWRDRLSVQWHRFTFGVRG